MHVLVVQIELDTWRSPPAVIWCHRSSICTMDLPALRTISFFAQEWTRLHGHRHRGWPTTASAAGRASDRMLARDAQRDGQTLNGTDKVKT